MREIQDRSSAPNTLDASDTPDPHWFWPLLWIVLIPVATIPLTAFITDRIAYGIPGACQLTPGFFGATASCPGIAILLMLTPGFLNLVPMLWLRSTHPKARIAALWASCLGAARLVVPAIAVLASPSGGSISGQFLWTGFPNAGYGPSLALFGLALWLATFPVVWLVARRV